MRTRLAAAGAAAAIVAGIVPAALSSSAQASACAPNAPSVTFSDPSGDATRVIEDTFVYSDPGLDIVSASVTWDEPEQDLVFEIELLDLQDTPPVGSHGDYFDFNFAVAGTSYYAQPSWDRLEEGPLFVLGKFETTRTTLARDLEGTYDVDADTITIRVPAVARNADGDVTFQLRAGDQVGPFEVVSRRQMVALVPNADSATGECRVTVGNVVPPADGTGLPALDDLGDALAWDGIATGAFSASETCVGCVEEAFDLIAPSTGGTLTISLSDIVDATGTADLDLRLRGPNAMHLLTDDIGNGDTISVAIPGDGSANGRYTVEVLSYTAVEVGYTVTASLA